MRLYVCMCVCGGGWGGMCEKGKRRRGKRKEESGGVGKEQKKRSGREGKGML